MPIRTARRSTARIKAWEEGRLEDLLAEATAKARVREAKAEARREEDRKLLRKFPIDPDAHEAEVRAALAKTKERKRKFGHPNRKARQA